MSLHSHTVVQNKQEGEDKRPSDRTYRYTHTLLYKTNKKKKTKDLLTEPTDTLTHCCTNQTRRRRQKSFCQNLQVHSQTAVHNRKRSGRQQSFCQNLQVHSQAAVNKSSVRFCRQSVHVLVQQAYRDDCCHSQHCTVCSAMGDQAGACLCQL